MPTSTPYFVVQAPIKAEGSAPSEFGTQGIKTDVILEDTSGSGVTIDSVLLKDGGITLSGSTAIKADIISEATGAAGVTVDGVLLKDGGAVFADGATIEVDTVNEATAAAGVTVDGVLLKDGGAVFADGATIEVDTVNEATAAAGVTLDGVLCKDGGVTLAGATALSTDIISEKTATSGVTIDSLLVKDGGYVAAGATDQNGQELILDADGDTSITADTDDQIDVRISGADDFQFTANSFTALTGSKVYTNAIAETDASNGIDVDGLLVRDGQLEVTAGAGAGPGGSIGAVEYAPAVRQVAIAFTGQVVPLTDEAGVVAYGSTKIYDLPAGAIMFLGATANLAITKSSAGVNADWDGDFGVGTSQANNDANLAAGEQNLIPTTATPQAVAGATTAKGQSTATEAPVIHDGTTTAIDVYLNFLVDDADHDVTTTPCNLIVDGYVYLTYANLGDY